jgi:hypothetical protein
MKCTCVRDKALLGLQSASNRLNLCGKSSHITEVTVNCEYMTLASGAMEVQVWPPQTSEDMRCYWR